MKLRLDRKQKNKFIHNILKFSIPPLLIYLGSMALVLGQENHLISLKDIIPNNFTLGSFLTYIISILTDLQRKLKESE